MPQYMLSVNGPETKDENQDLTIIEKVWVIFLSLYSSLCLATHVELEASYSTTSKKLTTEYEFTQPTEFPNSGKKNTGLAVT